MASSKWPGRNSFAWMNSSGGAWPHSKTPAKSSLTQKRLTLGRRSARKHWFRAITHDSVRRVSQPGSNSPHRAPLNTHDAWNSVGQAKGSFMTFPRLILALACLMSGTLAAQEAKVTQLLSKDLTNLPGKEGLMITVEYPPGSSDPVHRHNAHAFVYVLEGSIVMQVRGGKEVTLTPGQTFYEGPDDIHVVGRNASKTKPAKFVVFLVKDKGAPVVVPAQ